MGRFSFLNIVNSILRIIMHLSCTLYLPSTLSQKLFHFLYNGYKEMLFQKQYEDHQSLS